MAKDADIELGGLQIWILKREFPGASQYHDANWLTLRAVMQDLGAKVTVEGSLLMTQDFQRFRQQVIALYDTLSGEAELSGYEPNLVLHLKAITSGHIAGTVKITPDYMDQEHRFVFGTDQSYLPALIDQLDAVLATYPVIGSPG